MQNITGFTGNIDSESSLNQSMAEIFKQSSPLAKKRDKLKISIQKGKEVIQKIKEGDFTSDTINEFLELFYTGEELKKQKTKIAKSQRFKNNDIYVLTSFYHVLAARLGRLEEINEEIAEITNI